jgi:acyl-CoA synthetase (AMP-forming)/AMP-acid ligase II
MYPGTWAAKSPDKAAYIMSATGRTVTYAELDQVSNQLAHYWRRQGLQPGDHVGILMENNHQYLQVMWAALRSGLIYTPVNTHLRAREIIHILRDCGARSLITSAVFADLLDDILTQCPDLTSGLVVRGGAGVLTNFGATLADLPTTALEHEVLGADMHYTGGTTGLPKGGVQPQIEGADPATSAPPILPFFQAFGLDESTVFLSSGAPLYHAAPGRFAQFVTALGGTAVIMEKFDAETALRAIDEYGITHSQWVPTAFIRMLRLPEEVRAAYSGATHRSANHAAAPCPIWAKRQMIDWWGPILIEYYSGSEGGSTTILDSHEWLAHPGSVGKAHIGKIHIVDEATGEELGPGEIGTIRFECDERPVRYHGDPEMTANAYDEHGWSTVGDVGYLDEDGYLYLTDRQHHMIISGGVNIYPQETEDVLLQHPEVADAAVFGVPNEDLGEEVKAAVELTDLTAAGPETAERLIAFCRERLASYKCPRSIDFEAALPRTPAGKLYKHRLREKYLTAGRTLQERM